MNPGLKRAVLIFNFLGFAFYLFWLMKFDLGESLRSQGGILFYVPCLPFLVVFMLLLNPKPGPKHKPWWQSDEDFERDQAEKQKKAASATPASPASKS
jgi:hypothetical protein